MEALKQNKLVIACQVFEESSESVSATLGDYDTAEAATSSIPSASNRATTVVQRKKKSRNWADVVQGKSDHAKADHVCNAKLQKIELEEDFTLTESDLDDLDKVWGHALIGYVAGKHPGRKAIIDMGNKRA